MKILVGGAGVLLQAICKDLLAQVMKLWPPILSKYVIKLLMALKTMPTQFRKKIIVII